ncbi:MAG: head-tail connector protein [Oscillospiraceae bacterium]|nr:head-tail connector protein [Oscillospiraceae bacterium]
MTLLEKVKANLILEHDKDDVLLSNLINSAINYAESYQQILTGSYSSGEVTMPPTTEQAVIMLASHFYESRDGSTAGFYGDNVAASTQVWETVNRLLRLDRNWVV